MSGITYHLSVSRGENGSVFTNKQAERRQTSSEIWNLFLVAYHDGGALGVGYGQHTGDVRYELSMSKLLSQHNPSEEKEYEQAVS